MKREYDYIIIGSGIIGLTIAHTLKLTQENASILIIDKESFQAAHASSRNSGVLHAGFYYTTNSLKARFTVDGNKAMRNYCKANNLPINECGKLVVAQNQEELETLFELEKRGIANGSNITIIDEQAAFELEPNIKTFQKALYSPDTASVNPKIVCESIKNNIEESGVEFQFNTKFVGRDKDVLLTNRGEFKAKKIINCAGLYADKIAQEYGFGQKYTMIPFKGLYLKYTKNKTDIKTNIYPVPNLKNPFLGVHFTKTVDGSIKIGPTAIPAFWRENYKAFANFNLAEMTDVFIQESKLFFKNSFHFRDLAIEEIRKYSKRHFVNLAADMVQNIDPKGFTEYTEPGIRAQLLDKETHQLVQDFAVEGDEYSTHILNAVSPAFTCSFPFADHVVKNHIIS